jgi:hypothetical protein
MTETQGDHQSMEDRIESSCHLDVEDTEDDKMKKVLTR